MTNPWTQILDKVTPAPAWARGPIKTSVTHAGITVLGLMPYPMGLLGIGYFVWTTHSSMWVIGSGLTLAWYWVREYRQTGLVPRGKFTMRINGVDTSRSFAERYDTWLDVLFPTFAYGMQLGLLGWLW